MIIKGSDYISVWFKRWHILFAYMLPGHKRFGTFKLVKQINEKPGTARLYLLILEIEIRWR